MSDGETLITQTMMHRKLISFTPASSMGSTTAPGNIQIAAAICAEVNGRAKP